MEIHHKIEVIMNEDEINKAWGVTDLLTERCTTQINRLLSVFEDFQRLTTVGDTRFTFRDTQEIGMPPGWLDFIGDTKIYIVRRNVVPRTRRARRRLTPGTTATAPPRSCACRCGRASLRVLAAVDALAPRSDTK